MQNENKAYPMSRLLEALQLEQTLEQRVEAYMISQKEILGKIVDQCENKDPCAYQPGGDGDDFKRLGDTILKEYYWKPLFWSDSYFPTTVSENSLQMVQKKCLSPAKSDIKKCKDGWYR